MTAIRLGGALGVFVVLVFTLPAVHGWDERVTTWFQRAAPRLDGAASTVVLLGDAEVIIPAIALVAGLLLIRHRRSAIAALELAVRLVVASLVVVVLQHLIVHPTPPASLRRPLVTSGFHMPALPRSFAFGRTILTMASTAPYGFPSGHAARATLLAGVVFRTVPAAAGAFVISMMAALVYRGDHWLSEVLGGLCLGWGLSELGALISTARGKTPRE